MEIIFTPKARADLDYWQKSGNKGVKKKISSPLESISQTPFAGVGKPEALKHDLAGKWSRRIDKEHRIVYSVSNENLNVYSLKGHY